MSISIVSPSLINNGTRTVAPDSTVAGFSVLDVVSDASTETVLYADMPIKVQMKVTYTEPGMKGDTATNTLKPATVESGATTDIRTKHNTYINRFILL